MNNKPVYVSFANKKIEQNFERLKEEKFEDKQLYLFIQRAIDDLKKDPMCGIKLSKSLWPKSYIKQYRITNNDPIEFTMLLDSGADLPLISQDPIP